MPVLLRFAVTRLAVPRVEPRAIADGKAIQVNVMVWIFEREGESFELETRYDIDTAEFVLIKHQRNGEQQVERYRDPVAFRERLEILETQLAADRWQQRSPLLLHEGWKV